MGMSWMSSFWSRTRCRSRSSGPSNTASWTGIAWTVLCGAASGAGAPAAAVAAAGTGSTGPCLSSDPDSVADLRHLGLRHLRGPAGSVRQDVAHGDADRNDPPALLADGDEDLLHPLVHPFLALDAADPGGAAPVVDLRDRRLVGEDLVVREDVADLGVPLVRAALTGRVGDHGADLLPYPFRRVGQEDRVVVTLAHLPVVGAQQLRRLGEVRL